MTKQDKYRLSPAMAASVQRLSQPKTKMQLKRQPQIEFALDQAKKDQLRNWMKTPPLTSPMQKENVKRRLFVESPDMAEVFGKKTDEASRPRTVLTCLTNSMSWCGRDNMSR